MPPLTTWRPQESDGQGEITPSTNANIDTQSGLGITTQSGVTLIIESLVFTPTPATTWTENDSM